jgi:hypothetical protein
MRRCLIPVGVLAVCCLAFWLLLSSAARTGESQPNKLVANDIADEWLSKAGMPRPGGEYQGVGANAPKDSSKIYARSFTTSFATLEELWNFFAQKCGIDKKYDEKELFILSGESEAGYFVLVERLDRDNRNRSESVFGLRSSEYTVSVTLRPEAGGESVAGTLVVVVH